MTNTELKIKFENLYETIAKQYHEMCVQDEQGEILSFDDALYDDTVKKEAAFKRLFWTICKHEFDADIVDSIKWRLRYADYVDFFGQYKYFFGLVPSWQK